MSKSKSLALGMNFSTARQKLTRDLLWREIVRSGQNICHMCGQEMSRDDFHISHIDPWMDSDSPSDSFFDLDNVSYAHARCNVAEYANRKRTGCGSYSKYRRGCRCPDCREAQRIAHKDYHRRTYTTEARRERYRKYGC